MYVPQIALQAVAIEKRNQTAVGEQDLVWTEGWSDYITASKFKAAIHIQTRPILPDLSLSRSATQMRTDLKQKQQGECYMYKKWESKLRSEERILTQFTWLSFSLSSDRF